MRHKLPPYNRQHHHHHHHRDIDHDSYNPPSQPYIVLNKLFIILLEWSSLLQNQTSPSPSLDSLPDIMPYNTRRKSLSLPSLGIQLPQSSRASAAHRAAVAATASATPNGEHPPTKRVKRSHSSSSPSSPASSSSSAKPATPPLLPGPVAGGANPNTPQHHHHHHHRRGNSNATRPAARRPAPTYDHTPPPSPRSSCEPRIDTDNIGDEIVVGVIQQLEKTGNKPQLVKELAAVLCNSLDSVERYVSAAVDLR